MGEKKNRSISPTLRWFAVITNAALAVIFAWNLSRLWAIHERVQLAIRNPILSEDPDSFITQLLATDVPWWSWALTGGATAISLLLLLGLTLPRFSYQYYYVGVGSMVWLGIWITYVVAVLLASFLALTRFFS